VPHGQEHAGRHLALKREVYRYNGSEWRLCASIGWTYNGSSTSYLRHATQWSQMPCGSGWYTSLGMGMAYLNGQWHGGSRYSGNHAF
jgi:hypothetical protein